VAANDAAAQVRAGRQHEDRQGIGLRIFQTLLLRADRLIE